MSNTNQIQVFGRPGLALAGFFLAGYASAQTTGTGTIEGRVFNASNGSYLSNARVLNIPNAPNAG